MDKYLEFKEGMEAAETDTTPFIIPDEELTVVGDANKTQLNCHDFSITFRIPQKMEDGSVKQIKKTKEYKDRYITPRMDKPIAKVLTAVMPYFKKANDDGTVTDYTPEEAAQIVSSFGDDILDLMYEVVGQFLGIVPELRPYMLVDSVEDAMAKIIRQVPEIVNEADTFFG